MSAYFQHLKFRLVRLVFFTAIAGLFFSAFSDGLTGEYLITQRWRDLHSRYSALTNPAFLTEENYTSIRLCDALVLETFNLLETGITIPIKSNQALGVSYFSENAGKIHATQWGGTTGDSMTNFSNNGQPTNSNNLVMFSYANNLWNNFSIGLNFSVSYETNFDSSFDSAVVSTAEDFGISYRFPINPVLGEHIFGASIQNILPSQDVRKLGYVSGLKVSWLSYYWDKQLETGVDVNAKNLFTSVFTGKLSNNPEFDFSFRLGAWILRFLNLYVIAGSNYYGFSGGVNFPGINNGRDFSFLYQFMNITQTDAVFSHSVYLRIQLGQHREENRAQQLVRFTDKAPKELFNSADKLFNANKIWDAYFVLGQLSSQYPGFYKTDWVGYYKALCLEILDMREAAVVVYNKIKLEFPKSEVIPFVDLGLMRVYYKDNKVNDVAKEFALLNSVEVPDSIKFHASYLMAESFYNQNEFSQAMPLFSQIPEDHPDFLFAQHSLAIASMASGNTQGAIHALELCAASKPQTPAQQEIINRSLLILGYIFYEQLTLTKSVSLLRMVPKTSYYYEEALLGLGWAALKARQWNDCIANGQQLQKSSRLPLQCEGALIEGYANIMLKNYKRAYEVLQSGETKAKNLKKPAVDSLEKKRTAYFADIKNYATLIQSMDKAANNIQSSRALQQIDSLHTIQETTHKSLEQYFDRANEFKNQTLFSRTFDLIKSDIDYALATSEKLVRQSPKAEIQQKMETKQKEIDLKIEQLKHEMGKIDSTKK